MLYLTTFLNPKGAGKPQYQYFNSLLSILKFSFLYVIQINVMKCTQQRYSVRFAGIRSVYNQFKLMYTEMKY